MSDIMSEESKKENVNGNGEEAGHDGALWVPAWRRGRQAVMTEKLPLFMGLALGFGILYTFCLYGNPCGITYPVMIVCGYGVLTVMLKALSADIKRNSRFLVIAAVLLGISNCRTADPLLIMANKTAEFFLAVIFVVHQFYDDRNWSIGKYFSSMGVYLCCVIASTVYPFCQGRYFLRKVNVKKYRTVTMAAAGLAAALPIILIAGLLLGQADAVFGAIVTDWIKTFLNFRTIFVVFSMTASGMLGIYCLVLGACMDLVSRDEKMVRNREPVTAVTCMGAVALLYLFFCGIQIVYLFWGKGSLPEGMTYSSYARQGFFQLLFVAVMNLVMVLMNLKFFKKSRILNVILTVICGCTCVMIVSAAYRMILYVQEYHLTYLRVLVLWFLVLLAWLMAGVVVMIYKNTFPLFGWCLVTVTVFYVGFSFMRPDRVIAEYNVKHVDEWNLNDFTYMTHTLSADAAPAVLKALEKTDLPENFYWGSREKFLEDYYRWTVSGRYRVRSGDFRTLNFSFEKAEQLFKSRGVK